MIRNSLICKLINVQASMKENNEKKINNCDEIYKLIKAFPKDIAALDKRSVLAKVNSQGSGKDWNWENNDVNNLIIEYKEIFSFSLNMCTNSLPRSFFEF